MSSLSPQRDQRFQHHQNMKFGHIILFLSQHPSPQELPEQRPWPAPTVHLEPVCQARKKRYNKIQVQKYPETLLHVNIPQYLLMLALRFITYPAQLQLKSFVLRFVMHSINSALGRFCQNANFEQRPFQVHFSSIISRNIKETRQYLYR